MQTIKNTQSAFWLFAFLSLWVLGCEENPILIPELSVGERKVLVEELTGVRCPNCPDGTTELVGLTNQYGKNLIIVGIHAAPGYDVPYPESLYDFRTPKGTEMANFIGAASFFPTASINRRLVPPETEVYLPRSVWAGIIAEELAKEPEVGVFLETRYNAESRNLNIEVNISPKVNITAETRLTVLITQDSMRDVQKVGLNKVNDYYHRHVLRDIVSSATGDVIQEPMTAGALVRKQYTLKLPSDWEDHHCSVVAFVHHGTDPDREVLQVAEEYVRR